MIPRSWGYLAVLIFTLIAVIGLYEWGARNAETACRAESDSARADSVSRAIEQASKIALQDAELLAYHERGAERIRTVFRNLDKEVVRYVQAHSSLPDGNPVCLDAYGLRIWSAANAGGRIPSDAGSSSTGQLDDSVSGDRTSGIRSSNGFVDQPQQSDGTVPPMPAEAWRPDGMGTKTPIPIYAVIRAKTAPGFGGAGK